MRKHTFKNFIALLASSCIAMNMGMTAVASHAAEKTASTVPSTKGTVTITVYDEETGELFLEEGHFSIIGGGNGAGEGAGGAIHVGSWNTSEQNPYIKTDISGTSDHWSYGILYYGKNYDGYSYNIDYDKADSHFDFSDGLEQNVEIYMKKYYWDTDTVITTSGPVENKTTTTTTTVTETTVITTPDISETGYSLKVSFVNIATGEYVDDVNARIERWGIAYTPDDGNRFYTGEVDIIAEWNTSDVNPFISDTFYDNYRDYEYAVVVDKLPDGYTFYGRDSLMYGVHDFFDGVYTYTIELNDKDTPVTTTFHHGTNPTSTTTTTSTESSTGTTTTTYIRTTPFHSVSGFDTTVTVSAGEDLTMPFDTFLVKKVEFESDSPYITAELEDNNFEYMADYDHKLTIHCSENAVPGNATLTIIYHHYKTSEIAECTIEITITGEGLPPTASTEDIAGDANCDGIVNLADAVLIMQFYANPDKYGVGGSAETCMTAQGMKNADVEGNGNGITNMDALKIQMFLLGIIKELK